MKLKEFYDEIWPTEQAEITLKRVYIIAPYLSKSFFLALRKLEPQKVFIATDSGTSKKVCDDLEKYLKSELEGNIRLLESRAGAGIYHGKIYLFQWKNESTNRTKKILLFGSGNATSRGFGSNAEVFSWLNYSQLSNDDRGYIDDYFSAIFTEPSNGKAIKVDETWLSVGPGAPLMLPGLKVIREEQTAFAAWLQKGWLGHQYTADGTFGKFKIVLRKPLRLTGAINDLLTSNNFEPTIQKSLSFNYLGVADIETTEEDGEKFWKAKYFTETCYGFWTSAACYEAKRDGFYRQGIERRQQQLEMVFNAQDDDWETWKLEFIQRLQNIWAAIEDAESYFKTDENGYLDVEYYMTRCDSQLNRDYDKSKDGWFPDCYSKGYEFVETPPLRGFDRHWQDFRKSFGNALFFELQKQQSKSFLAQVVRECLDDMWVEVEDSEVLLGFLEKNWKKIAHRVVDFHHHRGSE